MIEKERKRYYILIKDFNTFMYDHTLRRGRKLFGRCCLQVFRIEKIFKCLIKDCFKINGKKGLNFILVILNTALKFMANKGL